MGIKDQLREHAASVTACLFGAAGGVLAAVRADDDRIGVPIGLAVIALVLGSYVITGWLTRRRTRRIRVPASVVTATVFGLAGAGLAAVLGVAWWLTAPLGLAVFTLVLLLHQATVWMTDRPTPSQSSPTRSSPTQSSPKQSTSLQPTPPVPIPDLETAPPQPATDPASAVTPDVPPRPVAEKTVGVVFIHGLFSSPDAWSSFVRLIEVDQDLAALDLLRFEYSSPVGRVNPMRRIPSFDTLGIKLKTYLEVLASRYSALVIISHSQGGLVAQRFLARMLRAGEGKNLAKVRLMVMFACPNSGAEFALTLRRLAWFWRHPQEEELRPLNAAITEAHSEVLNKIINARSVSDHECPIPFRVYAGESDNIVTSVSAHSVFPDRCIGVVAGDHSSLIRPSSAHHESYVTLKRDLLAVLDGLKLSSGESRP